MHGGLHENAASKTFAIAHLSNAKFPSAHRVFNDQHCLFKSFGAALRNKDSTEIREWLSDQVVSERHQWKLKVASVAPGECVVRGIHFEVHTYHDSIGVVVRNGDVDKTYWHEQFGAADAARSRLLPPTEN